MDVISENEEENEFLQKDKTGNLIIMGLTEQCYQDGSFSIEEICQLRLRSGSKTYLLKALKLNTIEAVYEDISQLEIFGDFQLLTSYPSKSIEKNDPKTLEELGFFPNANLIIKELK